MTCPDDDTIVDLLEARLDDGARASLLAHLDACDACRQLVADAGALAGDEPDDRDHVLGRGSMIGRYVISRVLGAGAMGVVYAAHDPQLGRDVAIKLLRPESLAGRSDEEAQAVMLREARTLARLAHPNVIAVYDADVHDGRVYIVMELVLGRTLGKWLSNESRGWREIRDVFVQAGRGLEAAHKAGVVHRDVKPDNVLIGDDGRVRVTDFGLARRAGPAPGTAPAGADVATSIGGTPAYMSPEQVAGLPLDARSDLFAFCVALYEALYGERPFDAVRRTPSGERPPELPRVIALRRAGVPSRARRALERALRSDRDERPRAMGELLADLDHRASITPRRIAVGAIAIGAIGAGVLLATRGGTSAPAPSEKAAAAAAAPASARVDAARAPVPACVDPAVAWGAVFDDAKHRALHDAFVATKQPIAEVQVAKTAEVIGVVHDRWIAAYTAACAAHARGEQSDAVFVRRQACLSMRHRELDDRVNDLIGNAGAYPDLVADGPAHIGQMRPIDDCALTRSDEQASIEIAPVRSPTAVLDHDGRIQVFAIGADGRPWRVAATTGDEVPAWGSWTPLADATGARQLVAIHDRDGDIAVMGIDGAGALASTYQTSWTWDDAHWGRMGDDAEQLAVADDASGRHHVFTVAGGVLRDTPQQAPNSGYDAPVTLRDRGVEQVVAVNDKPGGGGTLHVFTLVDHRVWHSWQEAGGGWATPRPIGVRDLRQLDGVVNLDGRLELVALDATNRAYHAWVLAPGADAASPKSWSDWTPLGTPTEIVHIRLARNANGSVEAAGVTPTHRLVHLWQAGKHLRWNDWWEDLPVDPQMQGVDDVLPFVDAGGHMYLFAVARTGALWMVWQTSYGPLHGWLVL
jgi:hypothetical protein